ncbi:MAG: cupin-like domain-containing protein [Alphaproteobacteria bacterium]|nr:cupin-like domain-containing protein [Alphaproteobacteria bacterium]
MSIVFADPSIARQNFLKRPFALKHGLADNVLFSLPRLVQLAQGMPRDAIEYSSGKVAVGAKAEDIPKIDMAAEAVIKSIETANAWLVIKRVERDPAYKAMLEQFVQEANAAAGLPRTAYSDVEGFIFVSSARATTPFHIDMEENILIQIKGDKFLRTFDNEDRALVGEAEMEISPSVHRNRKYEEWFESRATLHTLKPGDAVHMPYTIPHWVSTGDTYSISMAMTWKTPEVKRLNKIRLMNGTLRRYGLPQRPPGAAPHWDALKVVAHDIGQGALAPLRKSETLRRVLRGLIYGRKANYYLQAKQGM